MDWAFSGLDLDVEIHTAYGSCCQKPSLLVVSMPRSIQKNHSIDMRRCIIRGCAATDLDASAATAGIVPLHYTAPAAQRLFHRIHSPPKRHGTERCIRYSRGEGMRGMVYGWFMDGLWMVYPSLLNHPDSDGLCHPDSELPDSLIY